MGQNSGLLLKEVAAFQRCPLIEVSLYMKITTESGQAVYVYWNLSIQTPQVTT